MGLLLIPALLWSMGLALMGRGVDALWGDGWASLVVGGYCGLSALVFFNAIKDSYQRQVKR